MAFDPSSALTVSNLKGTLAGAAATLVVGAISHAGYLAIAATALGLPEATVGLVAMTIIGGIVNFAVTKISAVKNLNDLYNMIPQTYAEYPGDAPQPLVTTNLKQKDGSPVN